MQEPLRTLHAASGHRHERLPSSFGLALLMHAALFGSMAFVVQWNTQPQAPIVAELWSNVTPAPVPIQVAPPPPPPPPKAEPEPERKDADIVSKQETTKAPPPPPPKKEEVKKPEPKKEEKKPEPKKPEKPEVKKAEPKTPPPPSDLERLMAQAGASAPATPGAAATGSTVRGTDSGYAALVIGCIRPHIVFVVPEGTAPTARAEFQVELLPDATLTSVRLVKPSGLPGYDAAAERAIRRCDPFPRKPDGTVDRSITVVMTPVEAR